MATLADVTEDGACRSLANGILVQTARQDAAVNVRNAATVGGTVVVAPVDSEFILALLALGLNWARKHGPEQTSTQSLVQFLADPVAALDGGLVIQIRIDLPERAAGGLARVGRTPPTTPCGGCGRRRGRDGADRTGRRGRPAAAGRTRPGAARADRLGGGRLWPRP